MCFWLSSKLPRFESDNLPENSSLGESKPWELRLKLLDFGQFPASFRLEKHISTVNLDTFDYKLLNVVEPLTRSWKMTEFMQMSQNYRVLR